MIRKNQILKLTKISILLLVLLMIGISSCSKSNDQDIDYSPCRRSEKDIKANQDRTAMNMNRFVDCNNDRALKITWVR